MRMWHVFAVLLLGSSLLASSVARAEGAPGSANTTSGEGASKGSFGLGMILGEPTGLSARLYVSDDQALQAAAGFAFVGGGFHAHLDYVWHPYIFEDRDSFTLPLYVGPGLRAIQYDVGDGGDDFVALGLRGVLGIVFDFKTVPLDAFVEVAGVGEYAFRVDDGFGLSLNASLGARYYF